MLLQASILLPISSRSCCVLGRFPTVWYILTRGIVRDGFNLGAGALGKWGGSAGRGGCGGGGGEGGGGDGAGRGEGGGVGAGAGGAGGAGGAVGVVGWAGEAVGGWGGAGLGPEIWRFRGGVVVCGVGGGHRVAEEEVGGVERGGGGVEGCSGGGGAIGLDVGDLVGGGRGPVSYLRQSLVQLPGYANVNIFYQSNLGVCTGKPVVVLGAGSRSFVIESQATHYHHDVVPRGGGFGGVKGGSG